MLYSKSVAVTFLAVLLGRKGLRERYLFPTTAQPPTSGLGTSGHDVEHAHAHGMSETKASSPSATRTDPAALSSGNGTHELYTPRVSHPSPPRSGASQGTGHRVGAGTSRALSGKCMVFA